jgi:hypothetical protein
MEHAFKLKGTKSEYAVDNETDRRTVTYWNLVRSYLLLHYGENKFAIFYATYMGDNNDFLHDAKALEFESEAALTEFYERHKDEGKSDKPLIIRIANGKILD